LPDVFLGLPNACTRGVLILVFLLALGVGDATLVAAESRFPVSVSVGTHSLTVPWHPGPVTNRYNPVFVVGTDRTWKSGDRARLYYTANLGFFQHYWWMTGVFLSSELGVGYELPLGFHADARLGLGYLHYFSRRQTLELKDGVYVPARDWGKPSIMVPFSLLLGYRASHENPLRFAPFISAQWAVQAPFTEEAPAMTHFFLAVGVRIDLWQESSSEGR
jgi:hypothetical protein